MGVTGVDTVRIRVSKEMDITRGKMPENGILKRFHPPLQSADDARVGQQDGGK
jgi:hypothetical protein